MSYFYKLKQFKNLNFLEKFLTWIAIIGAIYFITAFFYISFSRITYPYELEWIEGGILEHVRRLFLKQNIYVEPSIYFIPFVYTPMYYYISLISTNIFGMNFFALRIVSLLSSVLIAIIIYIFSHKETKSWKLSLIIIGLFFALFRESGAWYDLARVDMLFHLFLLLSLYYLKYYRSFKHILIAATFFAFSYLTKQLSLFLLPPILIYLLFKNFRYACWFLMITTTIVFGFTFFVDKQTNGWYIYTTLTRVTKHALENKMLLGFWTSDIMYKLFFMVVVCLIGLYLLIKEKTELGQKIFYIIVLGSLVLISWAGRFHQGGYDNVLITAHLGILLFLSKTISLVKLHNTKLLVVTLVLIIAQLFSLVYPIKSQIPSKNDLKAGNRIVENIKKSDGDVLIPYHPYLAVYGGKQSYAHLVSLMELTGDITNDKNNVYGDKLISEYQELIKKQYFSKIILDYSVYLVMPKDELQKYYQNQGGPFKKDDDMMPVTGMQTRPVAEYVRTGK